ncbi:MAG: hypothetical protein HY774_25280 [Acidobacteria bacterium]|nr:hypothetical protein [Acidobacteriota bacterium]
MGNYKPLILILIIVLVWFQPCLAQERVKVHSQEHLNLISNQLATYVQSLEGRYLIMYKRGWADSGSISSLRQIYQSKQYLVTANILICENQEAAIKGFKELFPRSDGAVGMRLADIGDKAHGWFDGTLYVRKGNVLALIYIDQQPDTGKEVQQNENQSGQTTEANQSDEEPVNRNPNSSTRLEIAKRFARHIVGFFEEQAQ